jgi:hypothetical protein
MGNIQNINQKLKQIAKVLTFVFVFAFTKSWGQAILTFDFAGAAGSEVSLPSSTNDPNISSSTITRSGLTAAANGDRFGSTGFTTSATIDLTQYIEFTITPNAGFQISISSVVFLYQRSGTGPRTYALRSSFDGYVSNLGGALAGADVTTTQTFNFAFSALTPACNVPITFRLYAYNSEATGGTGGPEDGGNTTNKDIVVNGSVSSCGGCTPPSITTQPISVSTTTSGTASYTVVASGTTPTYQWQENTGSGFSNITNGGTNPTYAGATSSVLTISNPPLSMSGYSYQCVVTNTCPGTATTNGTSTLTVSSSAASGSCTVGGAMGTGYTTGCGNGSSGCNLSSVYSAFGTFCSASAVACGSCPNTNVSVTYNFESGCTATITAEYKARPAVSGTACNNSAMDSGDQIFITNSGGSVSAQTSTMQVTLTTCGAYPTLGTYTTAASSLSTGCGNSDGTVRMIITGGAATIGGVSNRGDEIITYTINASGTCSLCPTLLPVGLIDFYGVRNDDKNDIYWKVDFQEDIQYYMIEKSEDGINFDQFGIIPAYTYKSNDAKNYYMEDYSPYSDITYYRLSVRESNGAVKIYNTVYVDTKSMDHWGINHYQKEENLVIDFKNSVPKNSNVSLFDLSGKLLAEESVKNSQTVINVQNLAEGLYFIKIQSPYKTENFKIIIQK